MYVCVLRLPLFVIWVSLPFYSHATYVFKRLLVDGHLRLITPYLHGSTTVVEHFVTRNHNNIKVIEVASVYL